MTNARKPINYPAALLSLSGRRQRVLPMTLEICSLVPFNIIKVLKKSIPEAPTHSTEQVKSFGEIREGPHLHLYHPHFKFESDPPIFQKALSKMTNNH